MMRQRVLVVDDEPEIQRFLKTALETSGFDVLQAVNGAGRAYTWQSIQRQTSSC